MGDQLRSKFNPRSYQTVKQFIIQVDSIMVEIGK